MNGFGWDYPVISSVLAGTRDNRPEFFTPLKREDNREIQRLQQAENDEQKPESNCLSDTNS